MINAVSGGKSDMAAAGKEQESETKRARIRHQNTGRGLILMLGFRQQEEEGESTDRVAMRAISKGSLWAIGRPQETSKDSSPKS